MRAFTATLCSFLAAGLSGKAGAEPEILLPPDVYVAQLAPEALPAVEPEPVGFTLEAAEQMALTGNPALAEAGARIRAARGWQYQVGLPPNPTIGYAGSEIGNDGAAGQQGLYVGQEFIRGNKLGLNRAIEAREVMRLEQHFAAQQQRVLTDVRLAFYNAYLAERRVALSRQLQTVGNQLVATSRALLEAQEGRRTDLLQAEIESQRAGIDLAQAESNYRGAWRRLAAAVGQPEFPEQSLAADLNSITWCQSWEETIAALWQTSPETAAALAEIEKARVALARARVEPMPDINAQALVQYDDSTNDTVAGAQVTLPIPLWNRNQGGIARAQGDLMAARQRLQVVEMRLQRDLASQYQAYETAQARTATIRDEILGRAQQTLDAATQAYGAGELNFLDFLTVQRTYFQANLEYLTALAELVGSVERLRGNLLEGGYDFAEAPSGP
jgi:cobalt-zinc-cadmium efflux system outer membrane protein